MRTAISSFAWAQALILAFCATGHAPNNETIRVDDPADLVGAIASAPPGSIVYLPDRPFEMFSPIKIPDSIAIKGRPHTVVSVSSLDGFSVYGFDASGSRNVTVSNVSFYLSRLGGAVIGDRAVDLRIAGTTVTGNFYGAASYADSSEILVKITDGTGIRIKGSLVVNTFGGFFVLDSRGVVLDRNTLDHSNFGQLVASGQDVTVTNNQVFRSGLPNRAKTMGRQGDGFTSYGITGLTLEHNLFWGPYCYQAAFSQAPSSDVRIAHNVMARGITNAVYFAAKTQNVTVIDNDFVKNSGAAVASDRDLANAEIAGNRMDRDGVSLTGSFTGVRISDNQNLGGLTHDFTMRDYIDGSVIYAPAESHSEVTVAASSAARQTESWSLKTDVVAPASTEIRSKDLPTQPLGEVVQLVSGSPIDGGTKILLDGTAQNGIVTVSREEMGRVTIATSAISAQENIYVRSWTGTEPTPWQRVSIRSTADHSGNDIYHVEWPNDPIYEDEQAGIDTVVSSSPLYVLPPGVQNLTLVEDALWGFGNELDNEIVGNDRDNILDGGDGNDTIVAGPGTNTLYGGAGADTFVFSGVSATNIIYDYDPSVDRLVFTGEGEKPFDDLLSRSTDTESGLSIEYSDSSKLALINVRRADLENHQAQLSVRSQ